MRSIHWIVAWLSRWIDDVAAAILAAGKALRPTRRVRMVEQPDGTLLLKAMTRRPASAKGELIRYSEGRILGPLSGRARALAQRSRIEIELLPQRFVFRPLELPQRASEFLDGIIRAQIDRLAPWPPAQAAFGWSAPSEIGGARVRVTVAITAREAIASLAQAVGELKPPPKRPKQRRLPESRFSSSASRASAARCASVAF